MRDFGVHDILSGLLSTMGVQRLAPPRARVQVVDALTPRLKAFSTLNSLVDVYETEYTAKCSYLLLYSSRPIVLLTLAESPADDTHSQLG